MGAWQNAAAPSFRAELFLVFIKDSCSLFESTVQLLYAHVVYLNRSDRIAKWINFERDNYSVWIQQMSLPAPASDASCFYILLNHALGNMFFFKKKRIIVLVMQTLLLLSVINSLDPHSSF